MSSISAAVVNSISNTTNLTLATGNTVGPSIVLYAASPTITLFSNTSGLSALVANNSGVTIPNIFANNIVANSITSSSGTLSTSTINTTGGGGGAAISVYSGGDIALFSAGNTNNSSIFCDNAGEISFSGNTRAMGTILSVGDIIAYYSDDRLKDREENIPDALAKVKSLNGFYYKPNKTALNIGLEKNQLSRVGVSAQEVQKVLPHVVKDAAIGQGYLTVQYEKIVPLLIEAIKELSDKVEQLENKKCNCGCK